MEIMHEVKAEIVRRGMKYRDWAQILGLNYSRIINVLNGYIEANEDEKESIKKFMEGEC